MRRFWTIVVSLLVWGAIVFYVLWSSELGQRRRSEVVVSELSVRIADSARIDILTPEIVKEWIGEEGLDPRGQLIRDVNTWAISEMLEEKASVLHARAYVDLEGVTHVALLQRMPVARVITGNGYDFYLTEDGYVIPASGYAAQYIPIITGDFGLPFDKTYAGSLKLFAEDGQKKSGKNYIFLCKLINFVNYIRENDFWRSQIVQINVTEAGGNSSRGGGAYKEPEVEFIPRAGDHVVLLGRLEGYQRKLDNLMLFYRQAVPVEGWGKWRHINIKYDNQIVCK